MKTRILLSSCMAISILSCMVGKENSQISDIEWLVGTWEHKTVRGSMYETWKKVSRTELSGKSYILRDQDTVVLENIQLITKNNILTYIPAVNGQNNNQPISFPLVNRSGSRVIFQNKSHDFPQLISYTKISEDSLLAEISGIDKGVARSKAFSMRRIK